MFCLKTQFHLLSPQGYRVTCSVYKYEATLFLWKRWQDIIIQFLNALFAVFINLNVSLLNLYIYSMSQHKDRTLKELFQVWYFYFALAGFVYSIQERSHVTVQQTKRNFLCCKQNSWMFRKALTQPYRWSLQHVASYSLLVRFCRSSWLISLSGRPIPTLLTFSFSTLTYIQEEP